jgi:hemerythrin-like domain-containing protein
MSLFQLGKQSAPDFSDPIGFLEACHRRIEQRLDVLARVPAALRTGEAGSGDEARQALTAFLRHFDDAAVKHSLDEEASLFPRLKHPLVDELIAEHREHEAIYLALRDAARRVIAREAAARLVDDLDEHGRAMSAAYRDHIRREEAEIVPLARQLDGRELRAIGLEMRIRRG